MEKSFDFSIRIIELAKYLERERKQFPYCERLLTCGSGIAVSLRLAELYDYQNAASCRQALFYAAEVEYLLEIMVETDYLTQPQSKPILSDCRTIKTLIAEMLDKPNDNK